MLFASTVLPVPTDEPEHVVRHGPLDSRYIAMQPAGQVIVQVSCPGAVQVNADAGAIIPDATVTKAKTNPNSHFMRALGCIWAPNHWPDPICACDNATVKRLILGTSQQWKAARKVSRPCETIGSAG